MTEDDPEGGVGNKLWMGDVSLACSSVIPPSHLPTRSISYVPTFWGQYINSYGPTELVQVNLATLQSKNTLSLVYSYSGTLLFTVCSDLVARLLSSLVMCSVESVVPRAKG